MYPKEDWWTDDDLAFVENRTHVWREQVFHSSDSIKYPAENGWIRMSPLHERQVPPAGTTIIKDSWDHEHCKLCFATISVKPEHEHTGYINGEDPLKSDWLCRDCYMKYIVPRLKERA
jgi:hypothetical protein